MEKISTLSRDSIVTCADNQVVSVELSGEAVLLNVAAGIYYGLDMISAQIWELIKQPVTVSKLVETLTEEYNVEADRCEADVLTLLNNMADNGLIETKNGSAS